MELHPYCESRFAVGACIGYRPPLTIRKDQLR
jgi:hypothetical protein